ncbi:hypothetical protein [Bradyrhizobium elkanii]|uniref:hypothetical protein n=1 Tax=Bradyrhizobium elkanii TaxID=29448 RepID=UPI0035133898
MSIDYKRGSSLQEQVEGALDDLSKDTSSLNFRPGTLADEFTASSLQEQVEGALDDWNKKAENIGLSLDSLSRAAEKSLDSEYVSRRLANRMSISEAQAQGGSSDLVERSNLNEPAKNEVSLERQLGSASRSFEQKLDVFDKSLNGLRGAGQGKSAYEEGLDNLSNHLVSRLDEDAHHVSRKGEVISVSSANYGAYSEAFRSAEITAHEHMYGEHLEPMVEWMHKEDTLEHLAQNSNLQKVYGTYDDHEYAGVPGTSRAGFGQNGDLGTVSFTATDGHTISVRDGQIDFVDRDGNEKRIEGQDIKLGRSGIESLGESEKSVHSFIESGNLDQVIDRSHERQGAGIGD